jgi:hypothetical protein
MATAKKKTAAPVVVATPTAPKVAAMTKQPGAVFTEVDYAELAAAIGTPPGRAAWHLNEETNTLTAFHISLFTH